MKRTQILLFILILLTAVACSGESGDTAKTKAAPNTAAGADQSALIAKKCVGCHPADRGSDMHLDKAGWTKVIQRMQLHASGLISDEDAAKIIDHLVRTRGPK